MKVTLKSPITVGSDEGTIYIESPDLVKPSPAKSFIYEFLRELQYLEENCLRLADNIPANKYIWKPVQSGSSVCELFMEIAWRSFQTEFFGTPTPDEFKLKEMINLKKNKTKVTQTLQQSFLHFRKCLFTLSDVFLSREVNSAITDRTYQVHLIRKFTQLSMNIGKASVYSEIINNGKIKNG